MYINKSTLDAISGFTPFSASVYWTSSEVANNRAWKQNFSNGGQVSDNAKHSSSAVRAIRAVSGITSSSLSAITAEQTAQNTAIDLKANIASPTFTGTVTTPALIVSGNTYPNTTGNANQVLTTDGSGTLSWTTSSVNTVNGTANEIEVSTSDSTTTVGLPDNTTITTSLTVDGLYFGTGSGDGDNNLAVGSSMGSGTGKRNTAIGTRALESYSGTGFDNNTAVGYYNMRALSTGSGNTALGAENMFSLTTGTANTSIGNQTMLNVSTGSNNTGLGQRSGQSITTGTNNTLIGLNADVSSPNANNETVIGKGATGSGDNTVQLGNTSVTNVNTSGTITAGEITIPNTDGTSGQVLATDGSGTLSWTTSSAGVSGSGTANMIAKFDGSSTVLGNSSVYDDGTNVGIGTVSPAQLLHVKAASGDAKVLINANGEDDEAHLVLRSGGINKTAIVASGINNWGRTDLRFILNSYTNANDYGLSDTKMIIKNDGKVGIGTNSPTEKLDVAGNIKFSGALMPNNNAGSSGQVLTSSGTGVPTWTTISGGASSIDELSDAIHSNQYNTLIIGTTPSISAGASYSTGVGKRVLESITTGDENVAMGHQALGETTSGSLNTAIGSHVIFRNTTGSQNSAFGERVLEYNTTGSKNTGIGASAGDTNTTGTNNTLIGYNADLSSNNLTNATAIGANATVNTSNKIKLGNSNVTNVETAGSITAGAITIPNTDGTSGQVLATDGSGTLSWTTSSAGVSGSGTANMIAKFDGSSTVLGNSSVYDDGTNVGIGTVSPAQLLHVKAASGDAKVLINANGEDDEAHLVLRSGGINKTAIVASGINNWGRTDLRFILNSYTNANDYGLSDTKMIIKNDGKVGIGTNSPTEKLDVAGNIKFSGALMPNNNAGSSGQVLTSSGTGVPTWTTISGGASSIDELSDAIHSNQYNTLIIGTTPSISAGASYSTGVGKRVLESITTGDENVAMGHQALGETTSGSLNTAIGSHVIFRNTTGSQNSAFGERVLEYNTTGSKNTGIGASAGDTNTTGTNNTLIGYNADLSSNNLTNATAIGANATVNTSNKIKLGNSNVTNVETAGSITAGAITIPNTDGTSGQVLTTDGSGILSWSTPSNGSDSVYNVDTFYAELGGFVIEVRDGGKHGLVVAMQDQAVSTWFPIDNILNDATKHDADGAKFMDWRLPTIRELELIYIDKANISPMWSGNDYWSATRPNYSNAYFINMANGFGTSSYSPGANHSTNNSKAVRAVRTF